LEQQLAKKSWDIVLADWTVVGTHQGAWFFTVGQRHGLGLNFKCYVIKTDVKKNLVIVWDKSHEELSHTSLVALIGIGFVKFTLCHYKLELKLGIDRIHKKLFYFLECLKVLLNYVFLNHNGP
jgi:hypothetical protein